MSPIPSKEAIHRIALEVLKGGIEKPKIEFKRWRKCQDLAKVISAIANTEGDSVNNPLFKFPELKGDYGMLILGVDDETGEVIGLPDESPKWMRESKPDAVGTQLKQKLEKWIEPVPHLDVYVFDEENGRRWVVVLIPPSGPLRYLFKKNGDGVSTGDWLVRRGTRTERANALDQQRYFEKLVLAASERVRMDEDRIMRRIELLEEGVRRLQAPAPSPTSETNTDGAGRAEVSATDVHDRPTSVQPPQVASHTVVPPSVALQRHLAKPLDPTEQEVNRAFDEWMEALEGVGLRWDYRPTNQEELAKTVRTLEEASYEVVRSLAVLVAGDGEGKYAPLVRERLEEFALEHGRTLVDVTYNRAAAALHAYPGVLIENALATVAHAHKNASYLKMLKELRTLDYNERPLPWLPELRDRAVFASDWINTLCRQRMCDPISERIMGLLLEDPGLVREVLPRRVRDLERLFTQAELVLSMIALENTKDDPRGYFARYVYVFGNVGRDACAMLEGDHAHLDGLFDGTLEEALRGLWRYFSSLDGWLPCPKMMLHSWPDCLEKPSEE